MRYSHQPSERRDLLLGTAALGVGLTSIDSGTDRGQTATATATATRSIGPFDVIALYDASGPFFTTWQKAFPAATTTEWQLAEQLDPDAFGADGAWNLDFRCYAIRRPNGRVILVDTGIGPAGNPTTDWAPVPGHLPGRLATASIDPGDVDVVVLTHVHSDHVGWSVSPDGMPVFANARYVIQHDEIAALEAGGGELMLDYVVEPLRRTGQLHEVTGRTQLIGGGGEPSGRAGAGVAVLPTPGHTPGHQSVLVAHDRRQIVITGDVLVHAVQLVNPDIAYAFEDDQDAARRTRRALLAGADTHHALLATAHLKQPFVAAAHPPERSL